MMTTSPSPRPAEAADQAEWQRLWLLYCETLGAVLAEPVTAATWRRILAPDQSIWCLVVAGADGRLVGFANYLLHPHTWSARLVCYLEDLFVAPEARGSGAARALIDALTERGRANGWRRIYWHTHEDNYRARTLYDRVTPRTDYVRYDIPL
jgi:GNAT superfamily N-acetyltransferase